MLASGAVPSALILLMRIGTPESPLWLVDKGRTADAQKAVKGRRPVIVWSFALRVVPLAVLGSGTDLLAISLDRLSIGTAMLIGAGIAGVGWLVSFAWAEEARGRTMAEAGAPPGSKWPATPGGGGATACAEAVSGGPGQLAHSTGLHVRGCPESVFRRDGKFARPAS
jgi:hypothetical protein